MKNDSIFAKEFDNNETKQKTKNSTKFVFCFLKVLRYKKTKSNTQEKK